MSGSLLTPVHSHSSTIYDTSHSQLAVPTISNEKDPFLVAIDGDDPANPQNWSRPYRWYITMLSGLLVLNATFSSSAPSGIISNLMEEYHMSETVGVLTISLFVAGYCVGPLVWGPLSEQYGRRPVAVIAFFVYTCFQVGSALARNVPSILIFRFIGGTFAAAPLTNSGGIIADVWDVSTRGKALAVFALAPFAGPALGPTVAGFISVAGVDWRWVFWVMAIFAGVCLIAIIFTIPETYMPVLLVQKARRLRKETGDNRYYAPLERESVSFGERVENILAKPFKMLFYEPMLMAITIYMSFIYGCIYLLFEAFPIVFEEGHGFNAGISGLMFLPLALGGGVGVIVYLIVFGPRYERAVAKYAPNPVPPEVRLEMALIAAPAFCISFFWFAWTSQPSISYWAPLMSSGLLGFSIIWLFLPLLNYIIDTYLFAAASALAANTVVRSLFGAAFPLFATQMYNGLGPEWASSLLGFVALVMIPVPFVLIKFGPTLRQKSRYAPDRPLVQPTDKPEQPSSSV